MMAAHEATYRLYFKGLINTFGVHLLGILNTISIWWHALGTTSLAIAVLAKAPMHQTAKFVFTQFVDGTGTPGWGTRASHAYVAVIGILLAQYTLTGMYLHNLNMYSSFTVDQT